MPRPARVAAELPCSAHQDLETLRLAIRAAERRVAGAQPPVTRLGAEIAMADAAIGRLAEIEGDAAARMADWAANGQGAAPEPPVAELAHARSALVPLAATADAARAVLPAAQAALADAEHDLARLRGQLRSAAARALREDGATLVADYWRRWADLERLRRDLAALDHILAADFPLIHTATGRPTLEFLSPERRPAPELQNAIHTASATLPTQPDLARAWRELAAGLMG